SEQHQHGPSEAPKSSAALWKQVHPSTQQGSVPPHAPTATLSSRSPSPAPHFPFSRSSPAAHESAAPAPSSAPPCAREASASHVAPPPAPAAAHCASRPGAGSLSPDIASPHAVAPASPSSPEAEGANQTAPRSGAALRRGPAGAAAAGIFGVYL
ncbi:hypothetical protein AAZX31_09G065400, partial [Glycine max]